MARILALTYRWEVHTRLVYRELARRGHEAIVYALMDAMDDATVTRVPVGVRLTPARNIQPSVRQSNLFNEQVFFTTDCSAARALWRNRHEIDAVVCHGLFVMATPALLTVAKAAGIPFIGQTFLRPEKYDANRKGPIHLLRRQYFRSCDSVLAAGDLSILGRYGLPRDRIFSFDPFIDFEIPAGVAPRRSGGAPFTIGFAGQLLPLKGLLDLVEAYKILCAKYPGLALRIIGGTPPEMAGVGCEDAIRREAAVHGLSNLSISGWLARDEVAAELRRLDLLVFPSHSDTYPKAVMEAMAMGVPVALSDACGCVGNLARHGETAMVFRTRDSGDLSAKVEAALDDENLRELLASNALRAVRNQTPERAADQYELAIAAACSRRGTGRTVHA